MKVRAKMRVSAVTLTEAYKWNEEKHVNEPAGNSVLVQAHPVAGIDNKKWANATPGGEMRLQIDNQEAGAFFRPGQYLYVDITEAPEKDPDAQ